MSLAPWRRRPIEVGSDLPADAALSRLREDLRPWVEPSNPEVIVGTIDGRRLLLAGVMDGRQSTTGWPLRTAWWNSILRVEVLDRFGGGCTLRGSFGVPAFFLAGAAVGLLVWTGLLLLVCVSMVVLAMEGEWREAASGLAFMAFFGGGAAATFGFVTYANRRVLESEQVIRAWLSERIESG